VITQVGILPRLDSLWCSLSADLNNMDLRHRKHREILSGIEEGYRKKSGFRRTKALISLKHGKIKPRLLLETNRKSSTRFRLCQNQRPWMTLKGQYDYVCIALKTCTVTISLFIVSIQPPENNQIVYRKQLLTKD